MEIAQWFDEVEKTLGVSPKRRRQTRELITHVVSRLKSQPPRMLFDEYIGKVQKVAAQAGSAEEIERHTIARMGKEAFFERQERLALYSAAWAEAGVTGEDVPMDDLFDEDIPAPLEEDGGVGVDAGAAIEVDAGLLPIDAGAAGSVRPSTVAEADHDSCAAMRRKLISARDHYSNERTTMNWAAWKSHEELRERAIEAGCWSHEEELARDGLKGSEVKHKLLVAGWWCFGLGFVTLGISAILIFVVSDVATIVGAFLATPGGILLLIGLFMLPSVSYKYRNV
jgi:hypothetical protein